MRGLLSFFGKFFWLMVAVFAALIVGYGILHIVKTKMSGNVIGRVAAGIDSAASAG